MQWFVFPLNVMWKSNTSEMHGLSEIGPNVPAFLIKLWKLVNDPETDELISWSESGLSFTINQPARFARELLSLYYKHNNMASFIRQLNMYGFHKIVSEVGGLKNEREWIEFAHQYFIKDHPYLLENIKRKLPNPKPCVISNDQFTSSNIKNGTQSEILAKVLSDVNNLKGKQESWDARLASMKRENEALWRELAIFRQKHLKQEQIINRLIHFIVTMVQPSRNVPLRRRYPLMLSDIQPVKKITKLSGNDTSNISQGSPTGPTIHEIDNTDVLFGSTDQSTATNNDVEFISSNISTENTPYLIEIENSEGPSGRNNEGQKTLIGRTENIPEDWLEIQMTEGEIIDPLMPIDPAEVNPTVAAASLKQFEGADKVNTPISITIPSITMSTESGHKNITEKKVIYLTEENISKKQLKKATKKSATLKSDINRNSDICGDSDTSNSLLGLVLNDKKSKKCFIHSGKTPLKRIDDINSTISKASSDEKKSINITTSKNSGPDLGIDDLEFLLAEKQPNDDVAVSKVVDSDFMDKDSSADSVLKLNSLYNGTICEDQLSGNSPRESSTSKIAETKNLCSLPQEETFPSSSPSGLPDSADVSLSKNDSQNSINIINFEPESMAIVCQPHSSPAENLARELTSHVDSVQGEIDYLKEMLKGEGYSFDANNLHWLFSDDPISYGVLPSADDDDAQKKSDETGISGNELMTYGAPNLMDLVDMIGSTPSGQEWNNVLSPVSPAVADLATPAPSPASFSFPSASKRRKK